MNRPTEACWSAAEATARYGFQRFRPNRERDKGPPLREQIESGPDGVSLCSLIRRGNFVKNPAGNLVSLGGDRQARAAFEGAIQVEPRRIETTPFAAGAQ